MSSRMLQFVSTDRKMPEKRSADARAKDFGEIYNPYDKELAREQASRCSQCGVPYCQVHCPLSNNIPDWLNMAANGRMQEAYELSSATNNMPEICGRICPQDRLCEGNCVIEQAGHGTVTIGSIEKHITETAFAEGWVKPIKPKQELGLSIGIIGAGPAGLAAAEQMRKKGYEVHVYDRYDRSGGLLTYGIPGFKLEKPVMTRRHDLMLESGINFHLNADVGGDVKLADLRAKHDAILIATGVYKARDLAAPGSGVDGIVPALDFLTAHNRKDFGDAVPEFDSGRLNAKGKNVVVIGGGDTAMDCVRTSIRDGAKSVKCLYRRDQANMPGSQREVQNAMEEGVEFVWLTAPEAFHGTDKIDGVQAVRMHLGPADSTGRQNPEPVEGSSHKIEADLVIKALGFDPEDLPSMFNEPELKVSRWGTVSVSWKTMMTNLPGVFAAGDIVRGASLVVWAIRDGRDAAEAMHAYISEQATAEAA